MVSTPLLAMTGEIQHLQEATAAITRIRELLAKRRTIHDGEDERLPTGPLTVTFDHIYFHYDVASKSEDLTSPGESGNFAGFLLQLAGRAYIGAVGAHRQR